LAGFNPENSISLKYTLFSRLSILCAGGYQKYQPGYQKKNLGAKRQKNRSRKNAFAEFLPGGQKFGAGVEKNGNFLRFSLEKNSYLK